MSDSQIISLALREGGPSVLIEVPRTLAGNRPVGRAEDVTQAVVRTFGSAIGQVKDAVAVIIEEMGTLPRNADEFSLEFGIKLSAGADVIIAKTGVEGNIKVTLKWAAKKPSA